MFRHSVIPPFGVLGSPDLRGLISTLLVVADLFLVPSECMVVF